MSLPKFAKEFFRVIDQHIGPFDRPLQFRPFPFDAGGSLNFLTVNRGKESFVTYLSWDLAGHLHQKRGTLGRYELMAVCNEEDWCIDILTKIGRQSLHSTFEPGDTVDIGLWVQPTQSLQGVLFEEAFSIQLEISAKTERFGVLRCIGITRAELNFALRADTSRLIDALKASGVYPRTIVGRASISLPEVQA